MHVLCAPSTDSPNSLPIFDDKQTILLSNNTVVSTYDFSVQQKHPDAQYLQMGNYIVFVDKYHKTKMYTLMSHDGDDLTHTWHAEDVGLDLLNESSEKWDYTGQPHDIAWYLDNLVLKDSGWTIGINEASILTRALKFDGETDTQLRRLGDIANQFDGAEVDFTIEMNGAQVTKQVVNIYKKVGSSVTQGRYIDSVNLKSLHSSGSIADLVTALKPFGTQMDMPEGQEGEAPRITIADVAYDDGRYYSPKGHPYLYDREARQQWSRFKAYNYANQGEFDGYIVGSYSYDTKDPNELLNRALTELKSRNKPSETYEANLLDINADIGDYVQIAHNQYNPPIYLSARVESVTNCYTANGQDTGVLGDYRKLESDIDPRIKEMLNALENQIKSHYMWIRYAEDDKGKGMTSVPTVGTKYIAILVNKPTAIPSDNPADYAGHWQLIQGQDGSDGIPGPKGEDGKTSYTHFAYADNVSGTKDFSTTDPTGRSYMGVYSDFTKADSTNPSVYVWSYTKGETGPVGTQGIPGKPGIDGKTPYTHVAYADNDKGGGFSQSPDNKAYMGWYSDFTQADSNDPSLYGWSLIKGADGKDGADGIAGKDGVGVKATAITYAQSTSGNTPPTTGWTAGVPTLIKGQYLWTKTVWTYTDSSAETGYTVSYNAKDGNTGSDGRAGKDGVGIKSTLIEYVGAVSGTSNPTSGWSTTIPTVPAGQYLWTRTTWKYTDGTSEQGFTNALMGRTGVAGRDGSDGKDGVAGKDGIGVKSTTVTYQASTSGTTAPTGAWVASPTAVAGQYQWTRTVWTYTDGTTEVGYSVGHIGVDGATGKDGVAGKDGVGIKTTAITYATSTSGTSAPTSGWVSAPPSAAAGQFIWTRTIWTYTDNTTETGYSVGKIGEKGPKGDTGQGIPGTPGADGRTPYLHTAWANSFDGKNGFSTDVSTNKSYMGTYVNFTEADPTDPALYNWIELVGALVIGGRNYLLDTGSAKPWLKGSGSTNQIYGTWVFSFDSITNAPFTDGDPVTLSFSYITTGTGAFGTLLPQFNGVPWGAFGGGEPMKDTGRITRTINWESAWTTTGTATGISIRMDNVATTRTVMVYNVQFESGNKATDHKVAPEDTQALIDGLTVPNLVYNAGFRGTYKDGLDGWTKGENATPFYRTEITPYKGSNSVGYNQTLTNTANTYAGLYSKAFTVTSNQTGKVSISFAGWVTSLPASSWARAELYFYDAKGAVIGSSANTPSLDPSKTNQWQEIYLDGVSVPAAAVTAKLKWTICRGIGTNLHVQVYFSQPSVVANGRHVPFTDNQGSGSDISQTNDALIALNDVFDKTVVPVASITAPPSPKEGQGWWVLNSSQQMIGFKIYKNGEWADAPIQQSAMNIGTLNGNIINGATINSSNFNVAYDETEASSGRPMGPLFKGTQVIKNGSYLSDYQVKGSTQTGFTHITPGGLISRINNNDGSLLSQVTIGTGQLSLSDATYSGDLYPGDVERTSREVWTTSDGVNSPAPQCGFQKQFRRVWLDGLLAVMSATDAHQNFLFKLKNPKLYPTTSRWISLLSLADNPQTAIIRIDPDGSVVCVSSHANYLRCMAEGAFYLL